MLVSTHLQRVFLFKHEGSEIELSDPHTAFTPHNVMNFYSATYPVLTTAKLEGPEIRNDRLEFRFVTNIGTKG